MYDDKKYDVLGISNREIYGKTFDELRVMIGYDESKKFIYAKRAKLKAAKALGIPNYKEQISEELVVEMKVLLDELTYDQSNNAYIVQNGLKEALNMKNVIIEELEYQLRLKNDDE